MKIRIISIGKDRRGEFSNAIERYQKQLPWSLEVIEKEAKKPNAPVEKRMQEEAQLMLSAAQDTAIKVAMDERGKVISSPQFAEKLEFWQAQGQGDIAFFIGGADGLAPELLAQCDYKLSFGAMVWPHQMVRVMLTEQLYRAWSITAGHPYHRA
jgi:23S rRNA (pseudouridine1915-N3)-methyltransferase